MRNESSRSSLLLTTAAAFNRWLGKAVASLNAIGTLLIIVMMALICADVVGRNLLMKSLPGVIELVELGIVSIVFLQIADTLRTGKLMRSDALIKKVTNRFPLVGSVMNALFETTGAILFYFVTKGALGRFTEAWNGDFYLGNQGSFTAPTWPMELCVTLGSGFMCLLFVANAVRNLYSVFKFDSHAENNHLNVGSDS